MCDQYPDSPAAPPSAEALSPDKRDSIVISSQHIVRVPHQSASTFLLSLLRFCSKIQVKDRWTTLLTNHFVQRFSMEQKQSKGTKEEG